MNQRCSLEHLSCMQKYKYAVFCSLPSLCCGDSNCHLLASNWACFSGLPSLCCGDSALRMILLCLTTFAFVTCHKSHLHSISNSVKLLILRPQTNKQQTNKHTINGKVGWIQIVAFLPTQSFCKVFIYNTTVLFTGSWGHCGLRKLLYINATRKLLYG